MPLVRMSTSVATAEQSWSAGEEVDMTAEQARAAVTAGWGELVRHRPPETPEDRGPRPERPARAVTRRDRT